MPDIIFVSVPIAELAKESVKFGRKNNIPVVLDLRDHCSDILFTPSELAVQNLKKEGCKSNYIIQVGDIMCDVFLSVFNKLKKTIRPKRLLLPFTELKMLIQKQKC